MKNLHLLPTDKPSRLVLDSINNNLFLTTTKSFPSDIMKFKNIYITSDETAYPYALHLKKQEVLKIKGVGENSGELYHDKGFSYPDECQKIILTTDQDLIKDGVQAIDDDFLEWFVKNLSCEQVEVVDNLKYFNVDELRERHLKGLSHLYSEKIGYKIIIPEEEPKQEMRKVCKCKRAYENPLSEICSLCWNELYPNEKDEIKDEDLLEPKQETLKEVAERLHPEEWDWREREIFKEGAKWQQERMYSEEEVLNILVTLFFEKEDAITYFEQFKKK